MAMFFSNIKKNKFIRNIFIVASGTAFAQIIGIIAIPIITRLYTPEAFGVLGTFTTIINIVGPVAILSYPIAIVLPKKESTAQHLIKLSLGICLVMFFISALVLFLLFENIVSIFNLQLISSYLFLIPFVIILSGFMQISEQWLIRTRQFKVAAKTTVWQSLLMNFSKILVGFFYPAAAALVFIQTLGIALKTTLMLYLSKIPLVDKNIDVTKEEIIAVAKEYKDFPVYRSPQVLFSTISYGLPILLLAAFSGPVAAGLYSLGRQVLGIPVQLVGKAVQDVFYPRISDAYNNNENISNLMMKSIIGLFLIGCLPFGVVMVFGPQLFSVVFGEKWMEAGIYAQWIALMSFSMLVTRPVVVSIPVLNIQKQFLLFEVIGTIIKVGALLIGFYYLESNIYAIALFSVTGTLLYIYLTFYTFSKSKKVELKTS